MRQGKVGQTTLQAKRKVESRELSSKMGLECGLRSTNFSEVEDITMIYTQLSEVTCVCSAQFVLLVHGTARSISVVSLKAQGHVSNLTNWLNTRPYHHHRHEFY